MREHTPDLRANPLAKDLDHILIHTENLWEDLRGKRLFITGGTGFFGCWLLESFIWANDNLDLNASALILTRNYDAFKEYAPHLATHPAVHFHVGDVRHYGFPEGEFSHIIHGATTSAQATFQGEDPLDKFDTIVEGTRRTLEFATQCHNKKFLLTSSGVIYGKQPIGMTHISEDYRGAPDPTDPDSALGAGKRAAEFLCSIYSKKHDIETKIARCFSFVGPYLPLDIHYAIGNFIGDGLRGGPIQVKGDGTPNRSYLYAADLAIWLWTILFKGESCLPYNVGSEESMSIAEVAHEVAQSFPFSLPMKIARSAVPGQVAEYYVPATQRAQSNLGLKQTIGLRCAIQRTAAWYAPSFSRIT